MNLKIIAIAARKAAGLSPIDFAKKFRVSIDTYRTWERYDYNKFEENIAEKIRRFIDNQLTNTDLFKLILLRELYGETLYALLGTNKYSYSRWAHGKALPPRRTRDEINRLLDTNEVLPIEWEGVK